MLLTAQIITGLVLLIHVYIALLETVLFKGAGSKAFGYTSEQAERMAPLMLNQGFYNGFLVAALALGLFYPDPAVAKAFVLYGLLSVSVAGIVGAVTAGKRILYIQTVPAVAALAVYYLAN